MLEYYRIDILGETDVNKITGSREVNFRFQPKICNGCHDLLQNAMSFNDVAIASVKGNYYRIHFRYISKDEAIKFIMKS